MSEPPLRIAKAIFTIEGHPEMGDCEADIVHWQGKVWFVANIFLEHRTGRQIPAELVPLPLLAPLSEVDGVVQLGRSIPIELSYYPCPQPLRDALQVVDALEHVHIHGPGNIH